MKMDAIEYPVGHVKIPSFQRAQETFGGGEDQQQLLQVTPVGRWQGHGSKAARCKQGPLAQMLPPTHAVSSPSRTFRRVGGSICASDPPKKAASVEKEEAKKAAPKKKTESSDDEDSSEDEKL
jgi:hypothetical protein